MGGDLMQIRCPLCFKIKDFDLEQDDYLKFQNTLKPVCQSCSSDIRDQVRPTWQIIAGRVFPKSNKLM